MSRKFFPLLIALTLPVLLKAQSLQTWTWNSYNVRFKAPDNMVVQENDANGFQATNNSITMDIYPRRGENLTYDEMKNAIINWATQNGLTYDQVNSQGNQQPIYLQDLNRFWGCAIDGTKGNFDATAVIIVNPDHPDISFYVWISYSSPFYQYAVSMLESFEPI